jgi:hypothetical protein
MMTYTIMLHRGVAPVTPPAKPIFVKNLLAIGALLVLVVATFGPCFVVAAGFALGVVLAFLVTGA